QAEMDRMQKNTRQPAVLREIFAALGNDPHVIAECLARPILADRLIHNWYSYDERFHGALKDRIQNELRGATLQSMRGLSGHYSEVQIDKAANQLAIGKLSKLQEDGDRFYVNTVLEKNNQHLKIAIVEWNKKSFGEWWAAEKLRISSNIVEVPHLFNLS